jgi:hypothetical protein
MSQLTRNGKIAVISTVGRISKGANPVKSVAGCLLFPARRQHRGRLTLESRQALFDMVALYKQAYMPKEF